MVDDEYLYIWRNGGAERFSVMSKDRFAMMVRWLGQMSGCYDVLDIPNSAFQQVLLANKLKGRLSSLSVKRLQITANSPTKFWPLCPGTDFCRVLIQD